MNKKLYVSLFIFALSPAAPAADTVVLRDGRTIRNVHTRMNGKYLMLKSPGRKEYAVRGVSVRRIILAPVKINKPRARGKISRRRPVAWTRTRTRTSAPRRAVAPARLKHAPLSFYVRAARPSGPVLPADEFWALSPVSSPLLRGERKWLGWFLTLSKLAVLYYYDLYSRPVRVGLRGGADKATGTFAVLGFFAGNPIQRNWAYDYMIRFRDPVTGRVARRGILRERKASAAAALVVLTALDFGLTRAARAHVCIAMPSGGNRNDTRIRFAAKTNF